MVTLEFGLPDALRDAAARMYWAAFGPKLGRVLGPEGKAHHLLSRAMRADHALIAVEGGRLVGLCGFKTAQGAFVGATPDLMRDSYGRVGAGWRQAALGLLIQDTDNVRFLIDGLCVAEGQRGRGIGTALLDALGTEAARRGYPALRLDVVDTNLGAQRLYRRLGFAAVGRHPAGLAGALFGFQTTITMVRPLAHPR
ncbi:GNAT family N-acetyltransferase [Falsirhodobacter halotolerans]|nr:GNAT family N-acetyltransferase [Falsirhodobacter halotolerans]MCJ8140507.1 GNAT family N-acetyltransferase [Falsirhodobacter halotolerans]